MKKYYNGQVHIKYEMCQIDSSEIVAILKNSGFPILRYSFLFNDTDNSFVFILMYKKAI